MYAAKKWGNRSALVEGDLLITLLEMLKMFIFFGFWPKLKKAVLFAYNCALRVKKWQVEAGSLQKIKCVKKGLDRPPRLRKFLAYF